MAVTTRLILTLALIIAVLALAGCGSNKSTPASGFLHAASSTATIGHTATPTHTASSPSATATPTRPTATPVPPTATVAPPTATVAPPTPTTVAQSVNAPACYSPGANSCNCSDFATHAQAQQFHDMLDPNDVNKLDNNHDGVVCESLP